MSLGSPPRFSTKQRHHLFEAEQRIEPVDAYAPGLFGSLFFAIAVTGRYVAGRWDLVQLGCIIVAIVIWGLAFRLYRRTGELVIRLLGDEQRLELVGQGGVVTIQFNDLAKVEYREDESPGYTEFSLKSGAVEYLTELGRHEPMLAFVRSVYTGPMIYRRKPITKPEQLPGASAGKRRARHRRFPSR